MNVEGTSVIKLPKKYIKHFNYKAYIYQKQGRQQEYVTNFSIDKDFFYFPRNIEKFLKNWRGGNLTFNFNFIDKITDKKINLKKEFKLRDYQQEAITKIFSAWKNSKNDVLLQANTSFGKSFLVSYIISKLQRKTLILTDMTMLSEQMFKEISTNTDADIQIVTKDTKEVKDVNIVTYQLLNRNPILIDMFKNEIGLIVADEIQNTGAETVKNIVQQFPAKYRLGLSATPTRSDGLTEIINDIYPYKIIGKGVTLPVEVHFVEETEHILNPINYKQSLNEAITELFLPTIDLLIEKLVNKLNKSIMIAIDSKEIQTLLKEKYKDYGVGILNSDITSSEREQILTKYENEEIKILVGYKVLNKGISIPRMEVLVNLFAATTKENIEQLIGRLMRQHSKKNKAVFIDFVWTLNMNKQYIIKKNTFLKLKKESKITDIKIISHKKYKKLLQSL